MKYGTVCRTGRSGFTLVEIMLSMTIAALAFAGVASMLHSGHLLSSENRNRMYAQNALREESELFRNLTTTEFDAIDDLDGTEFTNDQLEKITEGSGTRSVAAAFGTGIRKVTLTVGWVSRSGASRSESVSTYVTREGLNGL